jgi:hypothetical protein
VDGVTVGIFVVSGLLSIICWVVLWRGKDHIVTKVIWTLMAAVPAVGPLLFAVLHDPPPIQPEVDRAVGGSWDAVPPASDTHHPGHHV